MRDVRWWLIGTQLLETERKRGNNSPKIQRGGNKGKIKEK
jgi:hypothetical protein